MFFNNKGSGLYMIIIILFFCFNFTSFGQVTVCGNLPLNRHGFIVFHEDTIKEPGNQTELCNRGISWFSKKKPELNSIIQTVEKIEGEGYIMLHYFGSNKERMEGGRVKYKISLHFRDGEYGYKFYNFLHNNEGFERFLNRHDPSYVPSWDDYINQVKCHVDSIITNLKEKMRPEEKEE